jgi:hypothetical protein
MFTQLLKLFLGRKPGERIDVKESDGNAHIAQQLAVTEPRHRHAVPSRDALLLTPCPGRLVRLGLRPLTLSWFLCAMEV